MAEQKIMIVDDDKNICELLRLYFEKEGFQTLIANNGVEAIETAKMEKPDLMLLDIMMPELDGWQVLREIRKFSEMPIIMLSAKSETFDKVLGLELGADDYIVKPFDSKEVVARVKAVLRRSAAVKEPEKDDGIVEYDKLKININNYEMIVDGKAVDTPPKELELIYHLASGYSRTVDVHIKRLREKLEGVSDKWELRTIWRVGYKFETKE